VRQPESRGILAALRESCPQVLEPLKPLQSCLWQSADRCSGLVVQPFGDECCGVKRLRATSLFSREQSEDAVGTRLQNVTG